MTATITGISTRQAQPQRANQPLELATVFHYPNGIDVAMHVVRDRGVKVGYDVTLVEWPKNVSIALREHGFVKAIRAAYPQATPTQLKAILSTLKKEKQIFVTGFAPSTTFFGLFEARSFFLPTK